MLRITKTAEPISVKNIVLVIYGLPGLRKTSLAETSSRPLLLDPDHGSHRAINRKDVVQVDSWDDIAAIEPSDVADYGTIVVDTVGRALDFMALDIISKNPKHGYMGNLSLQGFGVMKGRFNGWKNGMLALGKDIILVVHMEEKQEGDIVKERFDIQGGSRSEVYKSADAIGKIFIEGNKYRLDFSPREGSLGKNPAQFPILDVPDFLKVPDFLAGLIQQIKDSINKQSDEQRVHVQAVEAWKVRLAKASTAQQFNELLPDVQTASRIIKEMTWELAKKHGLKFDAEAKAFYAIPAMVPAASPTLDKAQPNVLTATLQAAVAAETPQASPEPQEAPVEPPKRGRGRPKKSPEPAQPEIVSTGDQTSWQGEIKNPPSFLLEGKLAEVRDLSTSDGRRYQSLKFANGDGKEFMVYNTKHEWFEALRSGSGKIVIFSAHDVPNSDPPKVVLDDVDSIEGEKYDQGKPVQRALTELFA